MPIILGGGTIGLINTAFSILFKETIVRAAVPAFFMISGALFFRNYTNESYVGKIKSRIFSLLIPYLIWDTVWMIFNIVISHSFISDYFIGRETFEISAQNILLGIFHYKGLQALWYVFDLIIFAIAAPVIELLISRKTTAIISIVAIMALSQFGITLPEAVFFDGTSIIYYMAGAFIGKYYFQEFMQKSKRRDIGFSAVICIVGIALQYGIVMEWLQLPTVLHVMLLAAMGISLWKLLDPLTDKIENIGFMKDSFLVYVIHGNLASIVTKLIYIVLPKSAYFAIPNYLLTAITVLLLIHTFCFIVKKYANPVYKVISGSRNG